MDTFFAQLDAASGDKLALVDPVRALKLLSQCNRAVVQIADEKTCLGTVCEVLVASGGYRMVWVGSSSARDPHLLPLAFAGHETGFLASTATSTAASAAAAEALHSTAVRFNLDFQQTPPGESSAEQAVREAALQRGYRSSTTLPLQHGKEVLGVLVLYGPAALPAVPEGEVALLQDIANTVAFALSTRRERARLEKSISKAVPGLSGPAGGSYFEHMLLNLSGALGCDTATLIRLVPEAPGRGRVLAGVSNGQVMPAIEFDMNSSPCRQLLAEPAVLQIGPLAQLYPYAVLTKDLLEGCASAAFLGHRLEDSKGQLLGMLCVVFKEVPHELDVQRLALQAFAARAAAEIERMDADQEIRRLNANLEERVQQRTAQLKLASDELESFCSSVSHDLRTPLSAVDGFATLLEQALASSEEPLAERQRHYLRRIRAGMVQMGDLMEALLQLARLVRAPMKLVPVDLSQMAREILSTYQAREPARRLEAEVEPGLVTSGDARLLRQLLDHLLGNAWKFSSGRALTHIRLGRAPACSDVPGQPVFVVEDQGAGFNMAYAQKLFGPFQRLHSPSEFEGSGIGLATVQRIVHRHGGRVWGEAEPDRGARFYFSLGPAGDQGYEPSI